MAVVINLIRSHRTRRDVVTLVSVAPDLHTETEEGLYDALDPVYDPKFHRASHVKFADGSITFVFPKWSTSEGPGKVRVYLISSSGAPVLTAVVTFN